MMNAIFTLSQTLHIGAGAFALVLFWLPAFLRKGSANHSRFGRYYVYAMYCVAATGCIMATLGLLDPLAVISHPAKDAEALAQQIATRSNTWIFLLYLSLLTVTTVRHGVLVLRHKTQRRQLQAPVHLLLMAGLTAAGPLLAIWGHGQQQILPVIFGVLGTLVGGGFLRYSFKASLSKMEWWIEHLGAMIGSGIACYTAFFAFGGSRLFVSHGNLQLLSWILPGVIGVGFIRYLGKHYRRKFAGQGA
ncbi:hypothetical protein [Shewanella salipaludis]|uniref:DUF2306 domain-containing protein n=1 Tax=Shewanella salipaludis TaxID=2723052 RepID=A0A972G855_9GAMM|nr:hypothetical protein [Shewanella salipaludis]NMH66240.1 hypothetical protein [Shewanella salipaludis]